MFLVALDTYGSFCEAAVEPSVDSGQTQLDAMDGQQLLADLLATPAELIADVDDLLDGGFGSAGFGPTLLAGFPVFQKLTDTSTFNSMEPPIHRARCLLTT